MKSIIDLHILQSYPPSNLNRDATGSPKTAVFGDARRGRISSQSIKRNVRQLMEQTLAETHHTVRTKRAILRVSEQLQARGVDSEEANVAARTAIEHGLGIKIETKKAPTGDADDNEAKTSDKAKKSGRESAKGLSTSVLLFLGEDELNRLTEVVHQNLEELKGGRLSPALKKELTRQLDGARAVGVALFGRFIAEAPDLQIDGAVSVAHAVTTSGVDVDHDFYTAVDDLLNEAESGADMMGTIDLVSGVYYRYCSIDLRQLLQNLGGDHELTSLAVTGLITHFIQARNQSMLRATAPYTLPQFVGVNLTRDWIPLSLVNAFDAPVSGGGRGLMRASIEALDQHHAALKAAYEPNTRSVAFTTDATLTSFEQVPTMRELLEAVEGFLDEALQG